MRERATATGVPRRPSLREPEVAELLLALRGRLSRDRHVVLSVDRTGRGTADRADAGRIAVAGPATADHLLRTRPWAAVVASAGRVDDAVTRVESRYVRYWRRHRARAPRGYEMRDARPTVMLVPGLGTVTSGRTIADARVVGDVARHSLGVATRVLDAFGSVRRLPERDLFDIDYWPLELAKLPDPSAATGSEGRVYIVTGAASGIGRVVALTLARLGAHLVVNDLDAGRLAAVASEIARIGQRPLAVEGDVSRAEVIRRMTRGAILTYGGIDGAVSNAGVAVTGRLDAVTTGDWQRSLAVNTTAHFLLTRRLLPIFRAQGIGGALVYVASKNAFSPGDGFGPYSVAKAAEVQLARLAAIEGGEIGVRANVVSPDAVFEGSRLWSPELRRARAAAHGIAVRELERFYARRLLGVRVRAEDVAEAVAFCLSDRSSRTTGCAITVDGGIASAFPR